jgi:hypothetical protein
MQCYSGYISTGLRREEVGAELSSMFHTPFQKKNVMISFK